MMEEHTKTGILVSEKTFGTLVCRDKECRHYAVDIGLFDSDLRLVGRYLYHCGYRSIKEARNMLGKCVQENIDPFLLIRPKNGKVVDLAAWKRRNKQ